MGLKVREGGDLVKILESALSLYTVVVIKIEKVNFKGGFSEVNLLF